MKKILILILFLSSVTQISAQEIEFETIDYKAFNASLMTGKYKDSDWRDDPVIVSLKFVGPFEGLKQTIVRNNDSPESSDITEIIITNKGLLDDSVMGVKYELSLKRTNNVWLIESAARAVKCWQGRGHSDYSPEPCK